MCDPRDLTHRGASAAAGLGDHRRGHTPRSVPGGSTMHFLQRTQDLMGKEDRGLPVLIFPSNPSGSTATAGSTLQTVHTQSVTWSTFALIGLDMSASSLSLPIFLRINFLISYLDSNRLTEHIRLTHTESFAEWQKAGAGCTSRAFKHPGHDVTAPDVWPSILTDYTYDSELDNADGVPLASRRSSMFPEGKHGHPYHLSSTINWSPPCHAELRQ